MNKKIKSPCIGKCKLENNVCVGCKRTSEEIKKWISFTDEERLNIIKKLKER